MGKESKEYAHPDLVGGGETTLHSHAGSGGGLNIVYGSYTGDNADGRQITLGFKCSLVIIAKSDGGTRGFLMPNSTITDSSNKDNRNDFGIHHLHASDGIVVSHTGGNNSLNAVLATYYYWAISE